MAHFDYLLLDGNETGDDLVDHFHIDSERLSDGRTRHSTNDREEIWIREPRPLGTGGFGAAWLEKERHGSQRVVKDVKKVLPGISSQYWIRELSSMALLSKNKQSFPEFYGWFQDPDFVYIAMENFPLGDLQQCITSPVVNQEAITIVSQIAKALDWMHRRKITHRDLKPANILVRRVAPAWWITVSDFGISKRIRGNTTVLHTSFEGDFVAPEVLGFVDDGTSGDYTNAVDLWALGCVAFWLLKHDIVIPRHKMLAYCLRPNERESVIGKLDLDEKPARFIELMLRPEPEQRGSAREASLHEWLVPPTPIKASSHDSATDAPNSNITVVKKTHSHDMRKKISTAQPRTHVVLDKRSEASYSEVTLPINREDIQNLSLREKLQRSLADPQRKMPINTEDIQNLSLREKLQRSLADPQRKMPINTEDIQNFSLKEKLQRALADSQLEMKERIAEDYHQNKSVQVFESLVGSASSAIPTSDAAAYFMTQGFHHTSGFIQRLCDAADIDLDGCLDQDEFTLLSTLYDEDKKETLRASLPGGKQCRGIPDPIPIRLIPSSKSYEAALNMMLRIAGFSTSTGMAKLNGERKCSIVMIECLCSRISSETLHYLCRKHFINHDILQIVVRTKFDDWSWAMICVEDRLSNLQNTIPWLCEVLEGKDGNTWRRLFQPLQQMLEVLVIEMSNSKSISTSVDTVQYVIVDIAYTDILESGVPVVFEPGDRLEVRGQMTNRARQKAWLVYKKNDEAIDSAQIPTSLVHLLSDITPKQFLAPLEVRRSGKQVEVDAEQERLPRAFRDSDQVGAAPETNSTSSALVGQVSQPQSQSNSKPQKSFLGERFTRRFHVLRGMTPSIRLGPGMDIAGPVRCRRRYDNALVWHTRYLSLHNGVVSIAFDDTPASGIWRRFLAKDIIHPLKRTSDEAYSFRIASSPSAYSTEDPDELVIAVDNQYDLELWVDRIDGQI